LFIRTTSDNESNVSNIHLIRQIIVNLFMNRNGAFCGCFIILLKVTFFQ
jgi:hypothetical protein